MIKTYKKLISLVCLIVALAWPQLILAASNNPALNTLDNVASGNAGPYSPSTSATLTEIVGTVVSVLLGLIGIIFLVLMIYAGFNWMTAQGDEEKVSKAKSTIIQAVIGIIIVVGSYAIWKFVFSKLF